ncbi:MAG: DEAD/DEAH box helicase family protein, partial [candidate division NC10 bacterium]
MSGFEVGEPILCGPYDEPAEHWRIVEGETPRPEPGRRPARYYYRPPGPVSETQGDDPGTLIELKLVTRVRRRLAEWQAAGRPGVTRTTQELLDYWAREGRQHRLFFAQREAAETIVFLTEARADFLQGIQIALDEPSEDRKAEGHTAFRRYACKMATGTGKTTVMAMLAAWSILNKVNDRSNARFSDVVLVVCPNVTIRSRLRELDPREGDASLYRTRDLVPPHLMADLVKGRVLVTNWHVFEPQGVNPGGVSAKVTRAGVAVRTMETITIGPKTTTARGRRYLTPDELDRQVAAGL